MAKVFYDHLISIHDVLVELNEHSLKHDEKIDLIQTVDTTIHYHVVNAILSNIPKDKHEEFLTRFKTAPFDKSHLHYLKSFEADIEKKIQEAADKAIKELVKDLKTARKQGK